MSTLLRWKLSWLWCLALAWAGCGEPQKQFGPTIPAAPADPLSGAKQGSCPVFLEERCQGSTLQRCEIFDKLRRNFVADPDPLLRRVFLYDRWYDLYHSPNGLTAERFFNGPMPAETPESQWGDPSNFGGYGGEGDAAIWTGAALTADIFRYAVTGTAADYQRMEDKVRALLRDFEVTHIPGYLARHHYLLVPPGTPLTDRIMMHAGDAASLDASNNPIESLDIDGLPDEYVSGVPDGKGGTVQGDPFWSGHPSIDQYTGPMTAFPIVYTLLKDESLKKKIVSQLTCYLKRLRRLEIRNLQKNPDVLRQVTDYFAGSSPKFDPGDIDLTKLDTLVAYYHAGFNRANAATFDRTCPDSVALTPTRVIDASSTSFMTDMLDLASDLGDDPQNPQPGQIDHFYLVNIRGGDSSHLLHLAAMAYFFTGEEQYRSFLFDELIGNLQADAVAQIMMAFRMPDWCFSYYGDHITYQTHWQFLTMLRDSPLRDQMIQAMEKEIWQKALFNHKSAKFEVMYASTVPAKVATGRDLALSELALQLNDFGGNGGVQDAPRRTYTRDRQTVVDQLPAGVTVRCPTEQERNFCEQGKTIFGIPLEQEIITFACDGRPAECTMADGKCALGLASYGLPASLRPYADFMWQRGPFDLGDQASVEGQLQSPGRDLSEPYWMARYYGYITEGKDQVLAWNDAGSCP